ncbi:hypothetical protein BS47DRAFT_1370157 [Hydnum rufescens UP504]|uniref:Uncharacterized protein n=1 Tax=Hydnum rufescens UP504 TaxID=1448309 RepID=A0A9P6DF37_9AGAM|nr:hypothetical protein BS47DRAFT_1370157 [Hydnum rufescens UP504]
MQYDEDTGDGDGPIERLNDTTPNDTADITPHRTTPTEAGVVLHKMKTRRMNPPPANDNAPAKRKPQTRPAKRTSAKQNPGTRVHDTGPQNPPDKPHTRFGRLMSPRPTTPKPT